MSNLVAITSLCQGASRVPPVMLSLHMMAHVTPMAHRLKPQSRASRLAARPRERVRVRERERVRSSNWPKPARANLRTYRHRPAARSARTGRARAAAECMRAVEWRVGGQRRLWWRRGDGQGGAPPPSAGPLGRGIAQCGELAAAAAAAAARCRAARGGPLVGRS